MKILCIGHATYDITIPLDGYPKENTKNRIGESIGCGGGPAANAAYLLGKWGMDTSIAALVGNDREGLIIKKEFEHVNVDTSYLIMDDDYETTKSYIIVNNQNGSRTSLASQKNPKYLNDLKIDIKPDIILVDGQELELSKQVIKENPEATVIIDAGRCSDEVVELSKYADYIVSSLSFAIDYTQAGDLELMFEKLMDSYNGKIVITLENVGCAYYDNGVKIINSVKVPAKDTTGAGDIFHGAFVYGVANNWDMYKILSFANTTAALSVMHLTGRKSIYPFDKVEEVYEGFKRSNIY